MSLTASDTYDIATVLVAKASTLQTLLSDSAIWTLGGATGLNRTELDLHSSQSGYGINDVVSDDLQEAIDLVKIATDKINTVLDM